LLKVIWKDAVWSKVISSAIIGAGAALLTAITYLNLWAKISDLLGSAQNVLINFWTFVFLQTSIPNWLFGALILNLVLTIIRFAKIIVFSKDQVTPTTLTELDYTEDQFYQITWRWKYNSNRLPELSPFCSHCDYRVFPKLHGTYNESILFYCENCFSNLQRFEKSYEQIERDVILKIDYNLRTGKWKEIVERKQESENAISENM
jgi:hypothetical protein